MPTAGPATEIATDRIRDSGRGGRYDVSPPRPARVMVGWAPVVRATKAWPSSCTRTASGTRTIHADEDLRPEAGIPAEDRHDDDERDVDRHREAEQPEPSDRSAALDHRHRHVPSLRAGPGAPRWTHPPPLAQSAEGPRNEHRGRLAMARPPGRDQTAPMERLVRLIGALTKHRDGAPLAVLLKAVSPDDAADEARRKMLSRDLEHLNALGYDIRNVADVGHRRRVPDARPGQPAAGAPVARAARRAAARRDRGRPRRDGGPPRHRRRGRRPAHRPRVGRPRPGPARHHPALPGAVQLQGRAAHGAPRAGAQRSVRLVPQRPRGGQRGGEGVRRVADERHRARPAGQRRGGRRAGPAVAGPVVLGGRPADRGGAAGAGGAPGDRREPARYAGTRRASRAASSS